MDELEFRRRLIAAPYEADDALQQALQEKPERLRQQADFQAFDDTIAQALAVDVPDGLAEQLILRQRFAQHKQQRQRHKWWFAMAASVILTVTATLTLWPQPQSNLANYALAHVYHEPDALQHLNENTSLQQMNAKLASYGLKANHELGHIFYANHCDFKGKRSLHLVLDYQGQRVTVFIVPGLNDFNETPQQFADDRFQGSFIGHGNTGLIVVGPSRQQVEGMNQTLSHALTWHNI